MTGLRKLNSGDSIEILGSLYPNCKLEKIYNSGNPYHYHVVEGRKSLVVHTPVNKSDLASVVAKLRLDHPNMPLLLGVIGNGVTEAHIVTLHIDAGGKWHVYDSKYSDGARFFSVDGRSNRSRIGRILSALNPFAARMEVVHIQSDSEPKTIPINYHKLGTQSFFDPNTCGLHTAQNIFNLSVLYMETIKNTVNPLDVMARSHEPVIEMGSRISKNKIDLSLTAFIRQAWQDTFKPAGEQGDQSNWTQYFFGVPKGGESRAWWLLVLPHSLKSLLKAVLVFPLQLVTEMAHMLQDDLFAFAPKSTLGQIVRSTLALPFAAAYRLLKPVANGLSWVSSPWQRGEAVDSDGVVEAGDARRRDPLAELGGPTANPKLAPFEPGRLASPSLGDGFSIIEVPNTGATPSDEPLEPTASPGHR